MKSLKPLCVALFCFMLSTISVVEAQADLVWSDTFTEADATPFSDRLTEMTGLGFTADVDGTGTIGIASNAITLSPDGGSDRIEFTSDAAALAGNFTFDILGDVTGLTGTSDQIFVQMVDGANRSTNGAPLPNFSDTLDSSTHGLGTTQTINYFFNASGSSITYAGPDASSQTLPAGNYDFWVGSTLTNADQTQSGQSGGSPTGGVDTLVLQGFNAASGSVWTVDNASFNTIDVATVPEPSSLALAGIFIAGFCMRRRK